MAFRIRTGLCNKEEAFKKITYSAVMYFKIKNKLEVNYLYFTRIRITFPTTNQFIHNKKII